MPTRTYGSGNGPGLRKNKGLKDLIEEKFGGGIKSSPAREMKTLIMSGMDALTTTEKMVTSVNRAVGQDVAQQIEVQARR